mgnify:CR=1 FL=1
MYGLTSPLISRFQFFSDVQKYSTPSSLNTFDFNQGVLRKFDISV